MSTTQVKAINYVVLFHDETNAQDFLVWEEQHEGRYLPHHGGVEYKHGKDKDGTEWTQETGKWNQPATQEALDGLLPHCTEKTEFFLRTKGINGKWVPGRTDVSKEQFIKAVSRGENQ